MCEAPGGVPGGRPEGGEVILGIVDLEGEVGWGGCHGCGGVDEASVGDVDEEVKVCKEVGHDERDGDIRDYELPGEGAVTEGESHRLVPIGDDVRTIGSYQMSIGTGTTTAVNHGLREEGSASTRVDEEAKTCEGIKHKKHISRDRGHHWKQLPHNTFFDHAHDFSHFLAEWPTQVW